MSLFTDITALRAFAVAAAELNMRRAADALNISQPPLSRKIRNLEERVGARLFARRSYGLELTEAGREVLDIIQPLLAMQEEAQGKLDNLKKTEPCRAGFTTAFEQGIFEPVINKLKSLWGSSLTLKRSSSIQLANEVAKGHLLVAWVALPLDKPGMGNVNLAYSEPLLAAIPENWHSRGSAIELCELNGRPFFWFPASRNPYWHERMARVFRQLAFKPEYLEEPLEYEVLLARIAAGEGWALIPASFAVLQRNGIRYMGARDLPPLELGIIFSDKAGENLAKKMATTVPGNICMLGKGLPLC